VISDAEAAWGRLDVPAFHDPLGSTGMTAMATSLDGERLVAVGFGPRGAVTWQTNDGAHWDRADVASPGSMSAVTAAGTGFVAVGVNWEAPNEDMGEGTAWWSADGSSWNLGDIERTTGAAAGGLDNLASGSDGLIATAEPPDEGGSRRLIVMYSRDGRAWRQTGSFSDYGGVASLIGVPDGYLAGGNSPGGNPAVWSSPDGKEWHGAALEATGINGAILDLVETDNGYVAVGWEQRHDAELPRAAAWYSIDGRTWQQASEIPGGTAPDRDVVLSSVTSWNGTVVATGPSPDGTLGIWVSDDGRSWGVVPASPAVDGPPGAFDLMDIAVIGSRLVIGGQLPNDDPSSTWSATVWSNPPPMTPAGPVPSRTDHACPSGQVRLLDVALLYPDERLRCFGKRKLTLSGYVGGFEGDADPGDPYWLIGPGTPLLPIEGQPGSVVYLATHAAEGSGLWDVFQDANIESSRVQVTGHFDDRAASTCRPPSSEMSIDEAVARCREAFVITAAKRLSD
jgi:hypothetical protein